VGGRKAVRARSYAKIPRMVRATDFLYRWIWDPDIAERVRFLRKISLFEGLEAGALGKVAMLVYEKDYRIGESVFHEGDMARAVFMIREGAVEVFKASAGREVLLARLGVGELFGEMALVHEAPRSATVRVVEPAEMFLLYKSDLDGLMERHPRIANRIIMNLVRMLIERLRETSEHFVVETLTKPSQTT